MSVRIAMWSGPRNISTAMMRAWGSRTDTFVSDEPLYGRYLKETGIDHPGREEVIASMETDLGRITSELVGPVPRGKEVWYQKHMAHHVLDGDDTSWTARLTNCFLIRSPREVIVSFAKVITTPTAADLGFAQQWKLFEQECDRLGRAAPVIDAKDVLQNPRGALSALCAAVGVVFDEAMLSWAPGLRETDGVWAKHWYENVSRSAGFEPYRERKEDVPRRLRGVLEECERVYDRLAAHKISPRV